MLWNIPQIARDPSPCQPNCLDMLLRTLPVVWQPCWQLVWSDQWRVGLCSHPLFPTPSVGISFICGPITLLRHLKLSLWWQVKSSLFHTYVIEFIAPVSDFTCTYIKFRSSQMYMKEIIREDASKKLL